MLFKKRISKGELRDVDVELVSLLFDDMRPVNQRGYIVKGKSTKVKSETVGDEGRLYVTLMEPDVKDAEGDFYNKAEIQKACDKFSEMGLSSKNDVNHNGKPVKDFVVAESYILKSADKEHFPETKVGSWVQVIKCKNLKSELWQKVKKGDFKGVSIYGKAKDIDNDISKAISELKSMLQKGEESFDATEFENRIKVLEEKLASQEEPHEEIEKSIKEVMDIMKKGISKSIQGEPERTTADKEVMINGEKIIVKSSHKEIYKGIADLDSGKKMNILTPSNTSLFIDEVVGSKPGDTLADISVLPLLKDESIDAGLIDDLVFKNSLDGSLTAQDVSSASISCTTGILNAEYTLGRNIVEFYKDKYGEEAFGAYVEQHIAKKAEKAMRLLLFKGDRDSGTAKLKALDGVIALATDASAVTEIDKDTYDSWANRFEQVLLGFTDEMLEEQENFNIYVSHKDLIRIRSELANRSTNLGDKLLLEGGKVYFSGIPVKSRLMEDDYIVAGLSKFIILGYRTDAELKVEHHGSDWKYHWYIRIRPGITYVDGFVKVYQLDET